MSKRSTGMIIIYGFHLWQSVLLNLKAITTTGAYSESCCQIESYDVKILGRGRGGGWGGKGSSERCLK